MPAAGGDLGYYDLGYSGGVSLLRRGRSEDADGLTVSLLDCGAGL
jgi:hypothetical protein